MAKETVKTIPPSTQSSSPRRDFLLAALDMSWQLAVVVLVPIIGGFELDKWLGTLPALTIAGFLIAMAGMAGVIWRQLRIFQLPPAKKSKDPRP